MNRSHRPMRLTFGKHRNAIVSALVPPAIAAGVVFSGADARAQAWPACVAQAQTACAMQNVGTQKVLSGTSSVKFGHSINVAVILYGSNWNSQKNTYLEDRVFALLQSLAESSYTASLPTYSGTGGTAASGDLYYGLVFRDSGSQGKTLTDASIQNVINRATDGGPNPNIIYLVLPDDTVTYTDNAGLAYCTTACGYNNYATIGGQTVHYAVVSDSLNCSKCAWNYITPNNNNGTDLIGAYDYELSTIAHELAEVVTDPYSNNGGWYSNGTGSATQSGDMCALEQGTFYTFNKNAGGVTLLDIRANFHGVSGDDFLLQTLRVNVNNGAFGYCANSYGGVFSGQNFGLRFSPFGSPPNGVWAPGNGWSGECPLGQPVSGLSAYTSGGRAHSVLCGSWSNSADFALPASQQHCEVVDFGLPTGANNNQLFTDPNDWAFGFYKGECYQNQYVAGVAQATNGEVSALLCCNGAVQHSSCNAVTIPQFTPHYDWDYGYNKATCGDGQYLAGVSASASTGMANSVLCCNP